MSGIHLFVPMLHLRDAVGEHTRALRDLLGAEGIECRVYTETPDPETAGETRPYLDYPDEAAVGDVLVYQMATRSAMTDWLAVRPEPVVINYHSITPPEYFAPWSTWMARHQARAREDLGRLAPAAALGIGVSTFDAGELVAAGCTDVVAVPVANVRLPPVEPDPVAVAARRAAGGHPRWLSVGRLAPNKAHQDTIAALFAARATSSPDARLTIVGSPSEPSYARALRRFAAELGLAGSVEFVSHLREGELAACYATADVLVMLSEHEGFGVPLVEAMVHGLPVVAFAAGAVPEVVGGAGVLLAHKGPRHVADEVAGLLADSDRREALVALGRERPSALGLDRAGSDLVAAVRGVAERASRPSADRRVGVPVRPGAAPSH